LMLCNVAFAINVVYSRGLVQTYGALRVTILTMILAAVPALAFFRPGVFDIIRNLDAFAWGSLFYLGFIGTIVVVIMWNFAVGQLRSATVGASLYVIPLLAAVSGWVVLGETLGSRSIMAGLIILAGVAISEFGGQWTVGQKKS
jgi:drug/metabolite transporter (DMT)-like permease